MCKKLLYIVIVQDFMLAYFNPQTSEDTRKSPPIPALRREPSPLVEVTNRKDHIPLCPHSKHSLHAYPCRNFCAPAVHCNYIAPSFWRIKPTEVGDSSFNNKWHLCPNNKMFFCHSSMQFVLNFFCLVSFDF